MIHIMYCMWVLTDELFDLQDTYRSIYICIIAGLSVLFMFIIMSSIVTIDLDNKAISINTNEHLVFDSHHSIFGAYMKIEINRKKLIDLMCVIGKSNNRMNYKYINLTKYSKSTINNTLNREVLYEHIEKLEDYIAKFDKGLSIDKDLSGGFLMEYLSMGLEFPYSLHDKLNKDHLLLYCNIFKTRIDKFNDEQQLVDYMRILRLIYHLYNKIDSSFNL
jgi:hypothetical protein